MITKITLRKQVISGNRFSMYLDYYPPVEHPVTGNKTRREFLKIWKYSKNEYKEVLELDEKGINRRKFKPVYINVIKNGHNVQIHKEIKLNQEQKNHNKYIDSLVEQIIKRRQNEYGKPDIYSRLEKEWLKIQELGSKLVLELYQEMTDKRDGSNRLIWLSSLRYLKGFIKPGLKFSDLTEKICNDYRDYLLTTKSFKSKNKNLSHNTSLSYYNKFKVVLKQAYRYGYLQIDLNARIDTIKEEETWKDYLTLPEINSLAKTECKLPQLKNAALFSCLTGLRFSDIQKLTWGEVEYIEGRGHVLHFRQQKTRQIELLPISDQAIYLMGERKDPDINVFEGLKYSAYTNKQLYLWIGAAGIIKDITFHSFRHSYGTNQLAMGTNIYVIMEMMGHKSIRSTQGYTKIVDPLKDAAAGAITLDLLQKGNNHE